MKNNINFYVPNNKKECEYIGFDFEKENPTFIFPCQYLTFKDENEQEKNKIYKKEAKNIITILKKIHKEYLFGGYNAELSQFYSMLWLIGDFIEHGYYKETEKIFNFDKYGKINWKRTIRTNSIFFCDENIVYNKMSRDKNIVNKSQILSQIYKSCLQYSVERIGFIFGIFKTEKSIFNIEHKEKEYLSYLLKKELRVTFKDYKKTLINHLLSIINNQNSQNRATGFSIYDIEFEYVFEKMINLVFGNQDVKKYFNKYQYCLPDEDHIKPTLPLRPDTILVDDKTYYIIDSKYYNFGYTLDYKDLPQATSIAKQLGYNRFIKENLANDCIIKSIFVLPFASKDENKIKFVGYARPINSQKEEDKIGIYLIDLKTLIDTYLNAAPQDEKLTPLKLLEIIR